MPPVFSSILEVALIVDPFTRHNRKTNKPTTRFVSITQSRHCAPETGLGQIKSNRCVTCNLIKLMCAIACCEYTVAERDKLRGSDLQSAPLQDTQGQYHINGVQQELEASAQIEHVHAVAVYALDTTSPVSPWQLLRRTG